MGKKQSSIFFESPAFAGYAPRDAEAEQRLKDAATMHFELTKMRVRLGEYYHQMHSANTKFKGKSFYIAFAHGDIRPGAPERVLFDELATNIEKLEGEIHAYKAKIYEQYESVELKLTSI